MAPAGALDRRSQAAEAAMKANRLNPLAIRDSVPSVTARRSPLGLIRAAAGPAVALFVIVYFAGSAIVGPNGLTSLAGYRTQRAERLQQLAALKTTRAQLEHRAALLDPAHVDSDLADQITRSQTGQIRPDEVILPTN